MQACHVAQAGRRLRQKGLAGTSNGAMVECRKSISFILSVIIMNNFTCLIQIKEVGRRQV
ncbi:hypothetical protein EGJ58_16735 [Brucella anthropi]|nr:hypothetical protein EGJ58_16735 [Brucella anthropi]